MVELQIVVTEKCNLNCSYCYMDNKNTFLTREAFDNLYESLPTNQEYQLDFFGGEPLLAWDMVKYIIERVSSDNRFKKINLPSNGLLLTQEIVDFILEYNINFSWSCDGIVEDNINAYINKHDLISQLSKGVCVVATPNNLDFIGNHKFFVDTFNVTPSFKLMKSGWSFDDVESFSENYEKYIDYITTEFTDNRIDIPQHINRQMKSLIGGLKRGTPEPVCVQGERICLMPDGSQGFCAMMCVEGGSDEYNPDLYVDCESCEIRNSCDRGCYIKVLSNGGVDKVMCELYKIMTKQTIKLNHSLRDDVMWLRYIRKVRL